MGIRAWVQTTFPVTAPCVCPLASPAKKAKAPKSGRPSNSPSLRPAFALQIWSDSRLLGELIPVPRMKHKRQQAQRSVAVVNVVLCRAFWGIADGWETSIYVQKRRWVRVSSHGEEERRSAI